MSKALPFPPPILYAASALLLLLSARSARAQEPATPAASLTIGRSALGAGEVRTLTTRSKSSMAVKASKGDTVLEENKQSNEDSETIELTLLEVKDGKPSKVQIKIIASESSMKEGEDKAQEGTAQEDKAQEDKAQKDQSPLLGRVILLSPGEVATAVAAGDGKELEPDLVDYARERFGYVLEGKLDHDFAAVLPDKPLTIGEEIKVDGEAARALIFGTEDFKDVSLVLTPTGMGTAGDIEVALFKVKVDVKGQADEEINMSMDLTGELKLCAKTGRIVSLNVKGRLGISGEPADPEAPGEGSVSIKGDGDVSIAVEASYGKAK